MPRQGLDLSRPAAALIFTLVIGGALALASWWGYGALGWVNANVHAPAVFFWLVYVQIVTDVLTLAAWLIKLAQRVFPQTRET